MEVGNFASPVHPMLIALNNIKQSIDFIAMQPEIAKLPESMVHALGMMQQEFLKVKGDEPNESPH